MDHEAVCKAESRQDVNSQMNDTHIGDSVTRPPSGDITDLDMARRGPGSLPVIKVEGDHNANTVLGHQWASSNPHVHLLPRRDGRIVLPRRYQQSLDAYKIQQSEQQSLEPEQRSLDPEQQSLDGNRSTQLGPQRIHHSRSQRTNYVSEGKPMVQVGDQGSDEDDVTLTEADYDVISNTSTSRDTPGEGDIGGPSPDTPSWYNDTPKENSGTPRASNDTNNRCGQTEDCDHYKTHTFRCSTDIGQTSSKYSDRLYDLDVAMKWIRQEVLHIKQEDRFLARRLLDISAQIHQLQGLPSHLSLSSNLARLGSRGSDMDVTTWSSFISLDERFLNASELISDSPMTLIKELLLSFQAGSSELQRDDRGTLGRGLRGYGAGMGDTLSRSATTRETNKPAPRIKRKNSLPMANELEEDHFFDDDYSD